MPAPARATKSTIKTLSPEERIRRRAYDLYVRRGNQSGSELDDWLQAEKEFLQMKPSTKRPLRCSASPDPSGGPATFTATFTNCLGVALTELQRDGVSSAGVLTGIRTCPQAT